MDHQQARTPGEYPPPYNYGAHNYGQPVPSFPPPPPGFGFEPQLGPPEDFEYHRLARSWERYSWWKPLITGLIGFVFYIVLVVIATTVWAVAAFISPQGPDSFFDSMLALDLSDPATFSFAMVSIILMLPALLLAALIMGPRPIGLLSSVTGKLRWRWLARCVGIAVVIYAVSFAVSFSLSAAVGEPAPPPDFGGEQVLLMVVLTLLLVPFQSATEEYVFRGYLMQLLGGWLKHPAFAILLPVPIFVLGHGYDLLGQIDIALFAIFAGWITWRTGGLEAAIAAHIINNVSLFLLGAVGTVDVNATEGSVPGLIISVLTMAGFAAMVLRAAGRTGISRTRTVRLPLPAAQYGGTDRAAL